MTGRGDPLANTSREVDAVKRDAPPADRLAHLNRVLRVDLTSEPVTNVMVDGYEESSSIVLVRPGARNIVFPGAAAMLNPTRLVAIVGAVIRRRLPAFKKEEAMDLADLIWSLSTMRTIYDSVESAADWGRAYIYAADETVSIVNEDSKLAGQATWDVFSTLRADGGGRAKVIPWLDDRRLVIRPWFHRHVQTDLGHEAMSEQRIASLMGLTGWTSLPRSRSALTAHDPKDNKRTIQLRFYVVPAGWEEPLDEGVEGAE